MITEIERKLQQRIDKRSNWITQAEKYAKDCDTEWMADDLPYLRGEQKFDKQVLAELISLRQQLNYCRENV